jgi:hypothetical protein
VHNLVTDLHLIYGNIKRLNDIGKYGQSQRRLLRPDEIFISEMTLENYLQGPMHKASKFWISTLGDHFRRFCKISSICFFKFFL